MVNPPRAGSSWAVVTCLWPTARARDLSDSAYLVCADCPSPSGLASAADIREDPGLRTPSLARLSPGTPSRAAGAGTPRLAAISSMPRRRAAAPSTSR
jgi:hypothetical protein